MLWSRGRWDERCSVGERREVVVGYQFRFQPIEKWIYGVGGLGEVGSEVERLGRRRALIITGKTLAESPVVEDIREVLGERVAGVFGECQQHTPESSVRGAVERAIEAEADVLVGVGGGSPIDTAKAAALRMLRRGEREWLPQIAIPTTLAGGEFTPAAGVTDDLARVKSVEVDARVVPCVVVHDPEVTLHTPMRLWLSTGIKAMDHAMEALWSYVPQPVTDVLSLEAIRRLLEALPKVYAEPGDVEARESCQVAAWMSIVGITSVGVRLSHPLGHQLGAKWDIPHGITSCVVLPPVLRLLSRRGSERIPIVAEALGCESGEAAADVLESFIDDLGLPTRLRQTGVAEGEVEEVASAVAAEIRSTEAGTAEWSESELVSILEEMW